MSTIFGIIVFVGLMTWMHKSGVDCCGGSSGRDDGKSSEKKNDGCCGTREKSIDVKKLDHREIIDVDFIEVDDDSKKKIQ